MRRIVLVCLAVLLVSAAGGAAAILAGMGAVEHAAGGSQGVRWPYLFGNRVLGRGVQRRVAGSVEVFGVKDSRAGMASAVMVYVASDSKATRLLLGLYSDQGGHPGVRMVQGSLRSPKPGAWNDVR